jgi:hypothetical protein
MKIDILLIQCSAVLAVSTQLELVGQIKAIDIDGGGIDIILQVFQCFLHFGDLHMINWSFLRFGML